jgi:hypothetical protein
MGGGELFIMTNPRKRRARKNRSGSSRRRNSRRNPSVKSKVRSFRRRSSRRNPVIAGFQGKELLMLALGATGGAIGTRSITQLILKDKNTGAMGYGASAAVAIALGWAAGKFLSKDLANGVVAGGLSAILLRIWSERVSGTSPAALSGYLGDLEFSSDGLGAYIDSGFPLPTVSTQQGNYLHVPTVGPQLVTAAQASTAPNVNVQPNDPSGLKRFAARF